MITPKLLVTPPTRVVIALLAPTRQELVNDPEYEPGYVRRRLGDLYSSPIEWVATGDWQRSALFYHLILPDTGEVLSSGVMAQKCRLKKGDKLQFSLKLRINDTPIDDYQRMQRDALRPTIVEIEKAPDPEPDEVPFRPGRVIDL